jgi:ABC-type transporter Mla subunit MlaD
MADKGAFLRVGLLLIAGVAAVVGLVLFLGGQQVRGGVPYETYFQETVEGLEVGSPVKYRGVTLGQVTELGLVSTAYASQQQPDFRPAAFDLVFVRFVIDPARVGRMPDRTTAIDLGLRIKLASQGITGITYLELDFVDPKIYPALTVPWQPQDQYIPSMPSTISQVQTAAQELFNKVQNIDLDRMAKSVQQVLDDLHGQLTTGDAHEAAASAAELLRTLDDQVKAADLPGVASDLRGAAVAVHGLADGPATKDVLASASHAADRLADAATRLTPLIAALEQTVRRTNGGVADVQADLIPVLRDVRDTAANLRETSEELRRYPASVLLGGPPPRHEPQQ